MMWLFDNYYINGVRLRIDEWHIFGLKEFNLLGKSKCEAFVNIGRYIHDNKTNSYDNVLINCFVVTIIHTVIFFKIYKGLIILNYLMKISNG